MFQTKFILFAVVALMAVSCADAIIGGQNAARAQFPYYAYIKTYRAKSDFWSLDAGVFFFQIYKYFYQRKRDGVEKNLSFNSFHCIYIYLVYST